MAIADDKNYEIQGLIENVNSCEHQLNSLLTQSGVDGDMLLLLDRNLVRSYEQLTKIEVANPEARLQRIEYLVEKVRLICEGSDHTDELLRCILADAAHLCDHSLKSEEATTNRSKSDRVKLAVAE